VRHLDDPDRLDIGSPAARMDLLAAAVGLGALPPTVTTWFVIFPLKGLSPGDAAASVGLVNALIVNGIWGLAIGFAWSRIFAVSSKNPAPVPYTPASSGRG
jgi:hypothetical protein